MQLWWEHDILAYRLMEKLSPWQEAVCIAVYATSQPIVRKLRFPHEFSKAIMRQLLTNLEVVRDDLIHCDLRLWLLLVAAYLSCGSESWTLIADDFSCLCSYLGLYSISEVETVLNEFHYLLPGCRDILQALWTSSTLK